MFLNLILDITIKSMIRREQIYFLLPNKYMNEKNW